MAVSLAADGYIYRVLRRRCTSRIPSRIHLIISALLILMALVAILIPRRDGDNATLLAVMWMLFGFLTVYVAKYVFVITDILACLPRFFGHRRLRWLSWTGAALALCVFATEWWGALVDRFRTEDNEVTVSIDGLPAAFDGLRIAQISDLHTGTFGTDTTFVSHLVDRVNALRPDVIVFTGDIVNSRTSELLPHTAPLSRLHAPMGVYSILGNHDYGDYANWPSTIAKKANLTLLKSLQEEMGWRLLLNETTMLHRGSDSLALIGVENIGDPPFAIYGSLPAAYPDLSDGVTKILLSHNPAHWADSIASTPAINIALTLSGHTHAMQIKVAEWSPAAWRYKQWGGLYHDADSTHALYVNIGAGTVGFPARIGATPEITLLTLKPTH